MAIVGAILRNFASPAGVAKRLLAAALVIGQRGFIGRLRELFE